jgi:hypothetical protein
MGQRLFPSFEQPLGGGVICSGIVRRTAMMNDEERISASDGSRKLVGRKDISDYSGGWGIPAFIAAVVLIAGVVIFSAAGSDRTRTAEYNLDAKPASSQPSPTGGARGRAAKIPNADVPTAPGSR